MEEVKSKWGGANIKKPEKVGGGGTASPSPPFPLPIVITHVVYRQSPKKTYPAIYLKRE